MMTLNEIAKELKVSKRTVYRWIRNGKLRALKLDGIYRVRELDFDRFLEEAEK